jgi:hypothetical protein
MSQVSETSKVVGPAPGGEVGKKNRRRASGGFRERTTILVILGLGILMSFLSPISSRWRISGPCS